MRVILKMIIVDDEPRHRKGLVNLIGKLRPNYEINQFKNGNEALEYLNKNKVDIIITDVKMPIMDGISFVKKHKENEKSAKIIILSGYANFEYAQNAISLGAFDYILKPVDEEIISEMLIKVEKSIYEEEEQRKREEQLLESLKSKMQVYSEWEFNKWIKGEVKKENLLEVKKYLAEDGQGWIIITKISDDIDENKEEILNNIKDVITEKLRCYGNVISFYLRDNEKMLIAAIKRNDNNFYEVEFQQLNEIVDYIKSEYCINIAIGVSSKCNSIYEDARRCFDEAIDALKLRFYFKNSKIMSFSDKKQIRKKSVIISYKDEERFNELICKQDKIEATNLVNNILSKFMECGYSEPNELKNYIIRLIINSTKEVENFMTSETYTEITTNIINTINLSKDIVELKRNCNLIIIKIISVLERWKSDKSRVIFDKYLKYMQDNYMYDISLESVSEKFHFNSSYFSAMFKERAGMNFVKYLLKLRIQKSCELLLNSDKKVYEISALVGYNDVKYFNRVFKNEMNVSPDEYRRLNSLNKRGAM